MRRANGTGSIQKMKGNRHKKWCALAPAIIDYQKGTVKRPFIGSFKTRIEAEKALIEYDPEKFQASKLKFKHIFDKWWSKHKDKLSEGSIKQYNSSVNKYLSKLDDCIFSNLTPIFLQNFFDENIKNKSAQLLAKNILVMVFDYAVKYQIVTNNFASTIDIIKQEKKLIRKIFTDEEIEILVKRNDIMAKRILILIYSGMRISEFLAMENDDIEENFFIVRDSKTEAGKGRKIPIHSKIKEYVSYFQKSDDEKVFFATNNKYPYNVFKKEFEIYIETLDMKHTIHDTRHTFATLLSRAGADKTSIIKMIGHSDITVTEKIYTHKNLNDLKNAIETI